MLHPTVFNTSEICHAFGVRHAVISPGSRNAPLIISFARNDKIKKWIIPDERSAGFIALGIAQKTKKPVVLCCTSGTALLNYAPAIAEAYYREIPLIVLSADRPTELIDQRDGQTIRQFEVLKNHVKVSAQLPVIQDDADAKKYESILLRTLAEIPNLPFGPIHINVPFREPFYPSEGQELNFSTPEIPALKSVSSEVKFSQKSFTKVLILIGQQAYDKELNTELKKFEEKIPILKSPLNNLEIAGIKHADLFIQDQEELQPELLITSGLSILSNRLKNYLRKYKPLAHWHFDPSGVEVDTFQTKPKIIRASLTDFLKQFSINPSSEFFTNWDELENRTRKILNSFSGNEFSETVAFHHVLHSLPKKIDLHLSNSMSVRFAEVFGTNSQSETWANRGASGIDGVTSTAMGTSLVSDQLNVLLIGDLAFLYDRNAFFHNHTYSNLRIIVFNNSGGGIFRLIGGPSNLPELETYFETRHERTSEYICKENSIEYSTSHTIKELSDRLKGFFDKSDNPKLLEIFTEPPINKIAYTQLLKKVKDATQGTL